MSCMNFVSDGLWNKSDILQDLIRQTCEEGCLLGVFSFLNDVTLLNPFLFVCYWYNI